MEAMLVEHIGKTYASGTHALQDVSFAIPQGEVFGFLGPNGSGKTTMVRLLNGMLAPSTGSAAVLGHDVVRASAEIHKKCGVLTETAAPYERMTAMDNLLFFARLHELPDARARERAEKLLREMDLWTDRDKRVRQFSTGMKKRLLLARALLHEPDVLFLDEPTSGLDPEAAAAVTSLLGALVRQEGVTVFLCTHQLKYAQDLCTLYGFIQKGTLMGIGTFDALLAQQGGRTRLVVRGSGLPPVTGASLAGIPLGAAALSDEKVPGITEITHEIRDDEEAAAFLSALHAAGCHVYEARQERWSLEDLYFSFRTSAHGTLKHADDDDDAVVKGTAVESAAEEREEKA